jgi:hypothetical protein
VGADELLDLALERLKAAGLVKDRGRQRTDSTYILAAARDLTRLELVLEAVRAALEELARGAPEILDGLVTAEWGERYGRPVRMCSQPSHPITRLTQAGADAAALLSGIRRQCPSLAAGPQVEALRRIMVQRFVTDARGRLRPRREEDGLPPAGRQICSPYDLDAWFVLRGNTRWMGYLAHVTETCDPAPGTVNVITDVATIVSSWDSAALPGIHARLQRRALLPGQHLVDGGYTSVALLDAAARDHEIELVGPLKAGGPWQGEDRLRPRGLHHRLRSPPGDLPSGQDHRELGRGPGDGPLHCRAVRFPPLRSMQGSQFLHARHLGAHHQLPSPPPARTAGPAPGRPGHPGVETSVRGPLGRRGHRE